MGLFTTTLNTCTQSAHPGGTLTKTELFFCNGSLDSLVCWALYTSATDSFPRHAAACLRCAAARFGFYL